MWKHCEKTHAIHKPPPASRPCPPNSLSNDQSLTWLRVGSSPALMCQGQSPFMPSQIMIHVVNMPTCSGLTLHYLSCYVPSSPTGLLSTPQNTVYPPTSAHLHRFFFVQYAPSPHPPFSSLIYPAVSAQTSPPQRDLFLTPRQRWQTPCYTLLYISSVVLITNLRITICQPHQTTSSFSGLGHHYTFGVQHKA